jgi:DNA topoisomerase-1
MPARWILREGSRPERFTYRTTDGQPVADEATLARIRSLAIPPAWRDVRIASSPRAELQAIGIDAKGRRQYRYHERAMRRGALRKYHRVRRMGLELPEIRRHVQRDFRAEGFAKKRVCAGAVKLISQGFFRVGGERSAEDNHFGLTTLRKRHAHVEGDSVVFDYKGKSGVEQHQTLVDRSLARFVGDLLSTPGRRLFRYQDEQGEWRDLTARDVNAYLKRDVGVPYTAKDFRTWGGTLRAAIVLAEVGPKESEYAAKRAVALVCRLVAAELGNTPTICKQSYIHPILFARYLDDGETIAPLLARVRPRRGPYAHAPEERALIRFLDKHFPERRRRRKARKSAERREPELLDAAQPGVARPEASPPEPEQEVETKAETALVP